MSVSQGNKTGRCQAENILRNLPWSSSPHVYYKSHLSDESEMKVTQSCPTLCVLMNYTSMEFSKPKYWSGYPFPSPGDLSNPGMEPRSPTLKVDSLPAEPQGKPCSTPGLPVLHFSQSLLKLMSIELVMPYNLCHPLLLLPSSFLSIMVFSSELAPHIWWPNYWSFSFSISPSNEYSGLISFRIDWFDLLAVQGNLNSLLQHPSLKTSIL